MRSRRVPSFRAPALTATLALLVAAACSAHATEEEAELMAELLGLRPGLTVADVGAGDGQFGEALARRLAGSGRVFLTEIDEDELRRLRERRDDSDLGNMTVIAGTATETGLPDACCDAILLRLVYHHMTHAEEMRAGLVRALRPEGLVLIVEMDSDSHGIEPQRLVDEMTADGFAVVSRHPEWGGHGDHYAVLFRRAETAGWPGE